MKRLKAAWKALTGLATPETVYVYSQGNPRRFVQLLNYRDMILALDAEGSLWQMKQEYDGFFVVQFVMESPRGY